ncbi:alanyl-tRNA editing protein [Candidatus Woesearchaeota archaeon]|nr:alanyl-tRNA editing protein [Candidatus Woesearchaeota archaeon]
MVPAFYQDAYLKELNAEVTEVNGKFIVLDDTIFYPSSGGQPYDSGKIIHENETYNIIFVKKFDNKLSHEIDKEGLKAGDKVKCILDWERRYLLMRMHTATHILSTLIHNKTKALITGNQLGLDKTRIDFSLENFNREDIKKYVDEANEIINHNLETKSYFITREEAMKIESLTKLAKGLDENLKEIRIVEIGDFDKQADGVTHVKNTKEIGKIELVEIENKGKNNRRVYFRLI